MIKFIVLTYTISLIGTFLLLLSYAIKNHDHMDGMDIFLIFCPILNTIAFIGGLKALIFSKDYRI